MEEFTRKLSYFKKMELALSLGSEFPVAKLDGQYWDR